jgi:hypothetical protein
MHAFPVDLYPHLAGPELEADPPELGVGVPVMLPKTAKARRAKEAVAWPERKERVDEWLGQQGGDK